MNKVLTFLKTLPGKVVLWILVGGTIVAILLQFLAKGVTLKAREMNLSALINDALSKLKVSQNQEKIKELDKPVKKEDLETEPEKVIKFYKDRK